MTAYSAAEIRAAERPLLDAGVPLMARAAAGLAREIAALSARHPGRVAVLAGSGDNGGDALFAAAALAQDGADVLVLPVGSRLHEEASAAAREAGVRFAEPSATADEVAGSAIVVDGMRGIGGDGTPGLRGVALEAARAIRPLLKRHGVVVVAVDVPSGISPDDGSADADVLPADLTVTFGAIKAGLLREPARSLAGRVVLVDIGLGLDG